MSLVLWIVGTMFFGSWPVLCCRVSSGRATKVDERSERNKFLASACVGDGLSDIPLMDRAPPFSLANISPCYTANCCKTNPERRIE